MKIGFDLDDTVVDLVGSFMPWHKKKYGTSARREDINFFDMGLVLGISKELTKERIDEFYDGSELENMPLVEGAEEVLTQLKAEGDELYIITARPKPLRERTKRYFDNVLPGIFKKICSSENQTSSTHNINKGQVCLDEKLQAFVEDGLLYATQCAKEGIITILLDAPWNQYDPNDPKNKGENVNFIRAYSWKDIATNIRFFRNFIG